MPKKVSMELKLARSSAYSSRELRASLSHVPQGGGHPAGSRPGIPSSASKKLYLKATRLRVKALEKGKNLSVTKAIEKSAIQSARGSQGADPFKVRAKKGLLPKGPTSLLREGVMGLAVKHAERVRGLLRKSARKRSEQLGLMPKSKEM